MQHTCAPRAVFCDHETLLQILQLWIALFLDDRIELTSKRQTRDYAIVQQMHETATEVLKDCQDLLSTAVPHPKSVRQANDAVLVFI
jgi:hypothetical protein